MLSHEDNVLLTRVEGDAPMGQMMRRYWLPALQSKDLERDGTPRRVKMFGEHLVAFRDSNGEVGILDEFCPHRGASLALGRNENCALTCLYHGWRVDKGGNLVDTPTEPEDSTFKDRIKHIAYSVKEVGGLVWIYMGPVGQEPEVPNFDWTVIPEDERMIIQVQSECNWAQTLEGAIDSAHSNFLHQSEIVPQASIAIEDGQSVFKDENILGRPSNDGRPKIEAVNTEYGLTYCAIRLPLVEPEKYRYVRSSVFIAPVFAAFPAPKGWANMQIFVPMDDSHTMIYFVRSKTDGVAITQNERDNHVQRAGAVIGVDIDENFVKSRGPWNEWMQDREAMQNGSFTGIHGVQNQDMAVQESMGAIYDRTREHLATSDVAVIRMRRLMLDSVRRFDEGEAPLALRVPIDYSKVKVMEKMIGVDESWKDHLELMLATS